MFPSFEAAWLSCLCLQPLYSQSFCWYVKEAGTSYVLNENCSFLVLEELESTWWQLADMKVNEIFSQGNKGKLILAVLIKGNKYIPGNKYI